MNLNRRTAAASLLGSIVVAEGIAALVRHRTRTRLFSEAEALARRLGKPLVVVGDPDAGAHTALVRAYGCGDVCVDLNGCPACPVAHRVDLTQSRIPMDDGSAVVFVSCVLEYVNDPAAAWRELLRVAGSPGNVLIATVQNWTLTGTLYPGARWHVTRRARNEPPQFRRVTSLRGAAFGAALATAGAAAALPSSGGSDVFLFIETGARDIARRPDDAHRARPGAEDHIERP